jgi:pyruvate dehydrogenase complex dehydrogenase (E1) component
MTLAPATPETAALTCPRRKNTYLPGTIHKRLQITADMRWPALPDVVAVIRPDRAAMRVTGWMSAFAGAAAVAEAGSGHVSPSTSREATARSTL